MRQTNLFALDDRGWYATLTLNSLQVTEKSVLALKPWGFGCQIQPDTEQQY